MSILGRSEILSALADGSIKVDPYDPECVGPASIDLHLSRAFRLFVRLPMHVQVEDDIDYKDHTKGIWIPEGQRLIMRPGETVLGITEERITLSPNYCGWLEGRSRFARVGLLIHISASFMQPGIDNHQVLEMSNFGHLDLEIAPGTKICQFIFQRMQGEGKYAGRFSGQTPDTFWRD
ncbi:MAG: dCTP deaminase [Deltaproteobacteria bacterium]|nr:MAG: dCTP deaminase [Deltaproteobacteria bacterium]